MKTKGTKNAKRVFAIFMAIAVILSMQVSAFAATVDNTGDDQGVVISGDTTLNIEKNLVVSNPALVGVAGPGIQFTYTVGSADVAAGTTVEDESGQTATVHSGPAYGLVLDSAPNYAQAELLNASAAGTNNAKNIVLHVDLTKFTDPGIYRYAITDTTTEAALTAAGIDRSENLDPVRYVDVYIQEVDSELVVEGYVVGSDADENGILAKETFDTSTTDETETATVFDTRDIFETYNATLSKSVTGAMGERTREFQFNITVSDSGRQYYAAKNTAPDGTSSLNQAAHTTALQTGLKDGDTYYIAGLRKNDTVQYRETNTSQETYAVSITGDVTSGAENVASGGYKTMTATTVPDAENVTFVNNLGSISPTGVITRFGPYIGMLVIAAVLIAVRVRAKRG